MEKPNRRSPDHELLVSLDGPRAALDHNHVGDLKSSVL